MRLEDLQRFYEILDRLEQMIGGACKLANCDGRMKWPNQGVYFFCEPGEERSDTGVGLRVMLVGTHATTGVSNTKLWTRLKQHKGNDRTGGGNHRTSVFRKEIGEALMERDGIECPTWENSLNTQSHDKDSEATLEKEDSMIIREMPFLWVAVEGETGRCRREYIEKNATALLSNFNKSPLDIASDTWLGHWSTRRQKVKINRSGQWSSQYVNATHNPKFLNVLESAVNEMET